MLVEAELQRLQIRRKIYLKTEQCGTWECGHYLLFQTQVFSAINKHSLSQFFSHLSPRDFKLFWNVYIVRENKKFTFFVCLRQLREHAEYRGKEEGN
jgi:hypothetical protein